MLKDSELKELSEADWSHGDLAAELKPLAHEWCTSKIRVHPWALSKTSFPEPR